MYKDRAVITWEVPAEDGGSPITGYYVERRLTTSSRWMAVNKSATTDLEITAEELVEDSEYEFRITAENKVGQGPPSSPTKPQVAKDPWGKENVEQN